MDKVSYALGIGIGRQLASMGAESLNIDDFAQAVKDAIAGKLQLGEQEAQELVQNFFAERRLRLRLLLPRRARLLRKLVRSSSPRTARRMVSSLLRAVCSIRFCVKVMARLLRLPIRLSATMRERLSMVLSLIALTTVVRLLPSH